MPTETKMLYNRRLLTDRGAFRYYRENAKHRDLDNTRRMENHATLVRSFYKKVSEKMVDNRNGVFLEHFGYFGMLMNPKKTTVKISRNWTSKELYLNPHTKGRVFHPMFFPICDNFRLKFFVMDRTFNRKIKSRLKEKLMQKVKYLNHYGILNSLYKNKK